MATEIVVVGAGKALVSELLKPVIEEAKNVWAFKSLFKELVATMENSLPIITQIETMQEDAEELKKLKHTIVEARAVVLECSSVKWWDPVSKAKCARKIKDVNKEMLEFCQVQLQFILVRNQMQSMAETAAINGQLQTIERKLELLSVPAPRVYSDFCLVPDLDIVPVGLDWPLLCVKEKLLDDAVDSLVVSAPGGCGKTTLATHLCHNREIKGNFKHIFFNVVSSKPKFRVLVQRLLQQNGYEAVTFDNDTQATVGLKKLLEELIKDGPILLVLDDVWCGAESLLQRFQIKIPGYKLLVTSRFDFPSLCFTYNLEPLRDEDAMNLLIHWASRPNHTSTYDYVERKKILKRCNGFPLLIKVVGVSLKGISLNQWKGQVESWCEGETILDNPQTIVLDCLQPSFNALKSNLKECFLDMSSFHEDQNIRASIIIDIWVELYDKSSSLCMTYLEDLDSQNLLKRTPIGKYEHGDGFYNDIFVTQHDVLRELAIHQSAREAIQERNRINLEIRDNKFPDWCMNIKQPINARLLSIYTDDLFSTSWVEMDCPNVEALVLNLSSSNYALPNFISTMKKLKVVIIINHGLDLAKLTNLSCLSSLPNLKRIRFEKVSITLLEIPQLQLGSLKKLSLVKCRIGEASTGFTGD